LVHDRALHPELIRSGDNGVRGAIGVIGSVVRWKRWCRVLGEYWYRGTHIEGVPSSSPIRAPQSGIASRDALHEWMKNQVIRPTCRSFTGIMSMSNRSEVPGSYRMRFTKIGEFFYLGPRDQCLLSRP